MHSANIEQEFQVAEFERSQRIERRNHERLIAGANRNISRIAADNRASASGQFRAFLAKIHPGHQPRRRAAAQ